MEYLLTDLCTLMDCVARAKGPTRSYWRALLQALDKLPRYLWGYAYVAEAREAAR